MDNVDNIDHMDKPFDRQLGKMSRNQLLILRYLLSKDDEIVTTREIAKRTGIVEKKLGGVLSALSRRVVQSESLLLPMGRQGALGLRWKLNSKALTTTLAEKQVKSLISSYK